MKNKLITISILVVFMFTGLGQIERAEAADSFADQKKNVAQNLSKVEKEIINTSEKVNKLNEDVAVLEAAIAANTKDVEQATSEVTKYEKEIESIKKEIKTLEKEIEERNLILKERLSSYQNSGGDLGYLEVIFGSAGFEDFISRYTAVTTITKADNDLVEAQKKAIKKVEEKELEIEENLVKAEETKNKLTKINEVKKSQKAELVNSVASVQTEMNKLESQKAAYVKEGNDIKALEEKAKIKLMQEKEEQERARNEQAEKEKKESSEQVVASKQSSQPAPKAEKSAPKVEKTTPKAKTETQSAPKQKTAPKKTSSQTTSTASGSDYVKEFKMEATAYTAECTGCSGITATGIDLNKDRHAKVVAVDPSVIPLGSRVWVSGYGVAIAGDTGGAIKGNKIDLHYPTKKAAYAFGRGQVTVRILK